MCDVDLLPAQPEGNDVPLELTLGFTVSKAHHQLLATWEHLRREAWR